MNLIVCCTPLQVLIAEKIIEYYPNEQFFGLMLAPLMNDKYQHYYDRLKEKCVMSDLIVENNYSRLGLIKKLLAWSKMMNSNYHIQKVFIANLNKFFVQGILSYIIHKSYYTFDDGTANLTGFKNKNNLTGLFYKILKKVLFVDDNIDKIIQNSDKHFSIYHHLTTNQKIQKIDLLLALKDNYDARQESISILLGQPLFQNDDKNIQLMNDIVKKYHIELYFPHPRETYYHRIVGANIIGSNLIFEDYLSMVFKEYKKIRLYYFFSSAGLNVAHIKNIELNSFYSNEFDIIDKEDIEKCYDIFNKLNIDIINIDELI